MHVRKSDGFFAGTLIELLNKNVPRKRVVVGDTDLLRNYTLFDVPKADAKRTVAALKGSQFFDKHLFSEIADPEKDYKTSSDRRSKENKKKKSKN